MNAERLHAVALAICDDLKSTKTPQLLEQLRNGLQNQVNQPQQPSYQQQVSDTLKKLSDSLADAEANDFTPVWQQAVDELGAAQLLGNVLMERVREVFERNQITPSVALEEITEIHKEADALQKSITQLVTAMEQLNIGSEELDPGECELGLLIPRDSIKNKLEAFSSELDILNKTFNTFSELASGSRPGFNIRTISSTDLTVFLDLAPEICACVAIAIERIVALYKQLLEIRVLRDKMSDQGLTDKSLQGVDAHANSHMKEGIEKVIAELIEKYAVKHDEGRKNELRTELRHALNRIANRVDRGYNFEVRVEPLAEPDEDEKDKQKDVREILSTALEAAQKIQFLEPGGNPILALPEPVDDEEEK